ncbi:MAG TPA: hypothetical protein V6C65_38880 [Allocoleopsis sp.]
MSYQIPNFENGLKIMAAAATVVTFEINACDGAIQGPVTKPLLSLVTGTSSSVVINDAFVEIGSLKDEYMREGLSQTRAQEIVLQLGAQHLQAYLYQLLANTGLSTSEAFVYLDALYEAAAKQRIFDKWEMLKTIKVWISHEDDMIRSRCVEMIEEINACEQDPQELISILRDQLQKEPAGSWVKEEIERVLNVCCAESEKKSASIG